MKVNELKSYLNNITTIDLDHKINHIASEIFKSGILRLKDKNMTDEYLKNIGYIEVNKENFITDFATKINNHYFRDSTPKQMNEYVLQWVLKFRNDTEIIDSFLTS